MKTDLLHRHIRFLEDRADRTHGLIKLLSLKLLRFVPCQTAFRHRVKHRVVVT